MRAREVVAELAKLNIKSIFVNEPAQYWDGRVTLHDGLYIQVGHDYLCLLHEDSKGKTKYVDMNATIDSIWLHITREEKHGKTD